MKFERCIVIVDSLSNDPLGKVTLPLDAFDGVDLRGKFIAVKKKKSTVIRFVPIDSESIVYDVYCEIASGHLSHFIIGLKEINEKLSEVNLVEEILDGTCEGGADIPCSFNGFIVIRGDQSIGLEAFKNALNDLKSDGTKIVNSVKIEHLKEKIA